MVSSAKLLNRNAKSTAVPSRALEQRLRPGVLPAAAVRLVAIGEVDYLIGVGLAVSSFPFLTV